MDTLSTAWQWLSSPLSGSSEHLVNSNVIWHARLMVLAWGFCLPLGALVARYFKVTPGQDWPHVLDNTAWWHSHRLLQYGGVLAMSVGVYLVWPNHKTDGLVWNAAGLHQAMGWCVLVLGWSQMLGGILRGSKGGPTDRQMAGDHYDMSRWRVVFESVHKSLGWLAIGLSVAVIVLGLLAADAPRWMLATLLVWWFVLCAVAVHLQRRGCCIDTYQAIWGPHTDMPGLKRPPIGWGVRRSAQHPWRSITNFDNF
jgi:hypothetical protein